MGATAWGHQGLSLSTSYEGVALRACRRSSSSGMELWGARGVIQGLGSRATCQSMVCWGPQNPAGAEPQTPDSLDHPAVWMRGGPTFARHKLCEGSWGWITILPTHQGS